MTRFLGFKEFKEKVQSDTPTILYENTSITTSFPNASIETATLPITLNQDCTQFKRLLVEGIVATNICKPTGAAEVTDIHTVAEVINPSANKIFALQDWFLYKAVSSINYAYCYRLVCKISADGLKFEPCITTDNGVCGWKRFGNVSDGYIDSSFAAGYPIAITKVIGFNNLK